MTEPITCEARLMGLSKVDRKDGEWTQITFQIHPDDCPYALFLLPLKTHVNLAISGMAESEDDAPDEPVKPKIGPVCMRAVLKCKEAAFLDFLHNSWPGHWNVYDDGHGLPAHEIGANVLRRLCGIESRRELDDPDKSQARLVFEEIESHYYASQHGDTTEAFEAMKGEGPE